MTQNDLMPKPRLAAPAAVDLKTTPDILLAATRVMVRDVSAWQQLYVSKRLTIPA